MKIIVRALALLVICLDQASAKSYVFNDEHCQIDIPDAWQEVTKESDELVSVKNANSDSFTISITHLGKHLDVQSSKLDDNIKQSLIEKGFEIIKDGPVEFQRQPALFVTATKTTSGFKFFIYDILLTQGTDLLTFTMVGDNDPSQDEHFKKILDTFSITPMPAASTTATSHPAVPATVPPAPSSSAPPHPSL